jgi:hypothetical protein
VKWFSALVGVFFVVGCGDTSSPIHSTAPRGIVESSTSGLSKDWEIRETNYKKYLVFKDAGGIIDERVEGEFVIFTANEGMRHDHTRVVTPVGDGLASRWHSVTEQYKARIPAPQ